MRCEPSKWNGLVTTPTVRMPASRAARAMTGAAAHAGGDEHHIGAVERLHDLVERLLGGGAAHIGARAGTEAARHADAELDAPLGEVLHHRLRVGVADQELAPDEVRADHVVDGIAARATDADDADTRLHLVLFPGNAQIDRHANPPTLGGPWCAGR
jgi:hypothetical protein